MKCRGYVCDVCGEHVPRYDCIVRLKARSGMFITYDADFVAELFSDRKTIDICINCIECFKVFMQGRRKAGGRT